MEKEWTVDKEFEEVFLHTLEQRHPEVLQNFKAGKLEKEDTDRVEALAAELSKPYQKK